MQRNRAVAIAQQQLYSSIWGLILDPNQAATTTDCSQISLFIPFCSVCVSLFLTSNVYNDVLGQSIKLPCTSTCVSVQLLLPV